MVSMGTFRLALGDATLLEVGGGSVTGMQEHQGGVVKLAPRPILPMMVRGLFSVAVILLFLGFLGAVAYLVWLMFTRLQPEVSSAISAGVLGLIALLWRNYLENRQRIEQQIRERKSAIYEEFLLFWFRTLQSLKSSGAESPTDEQVKFFVDFTPKLITWGSDEVIKKYTEFRRKFTTGEAVLGPNILFDFENLMLEIRKDTGHSNQSLQRGDLLRLFISDIDKYL